MFEYAAIAALTAICILQLIFAQKERQKLLDRLQSRSLGEYKAIETKEKEKKSDKKDEKSIEWV